MRVLTAFAFCFPPSRLTFKYTRTFHLDSSGTDGIPFMLQNKPKQRASVTIPSDGHDGIVLGGTQVLNLIGYRVVCEKLLHTG